VGFNQRIVEEFRANGGAVGGMFQGAPLVLLTTIGAKTGRPHTNPAVYLRDGDRILVFASNAGQPKNPNWFHNLLADSRATVEIGTGDGGVEIYAARAMPLTGDERDRLYQLQSQRDPAFREYQAKTARRIPVVALYRLADPGRNRAIGQLLVRVHGELRRELTSLRSQVGLAQGAGVDDGHRPPALGQDLIRHCLTLCDSLHTHHSKEDGAFTTIQAEFPELDRTLDRLRREHRLLAQGLDDLQTLLADHAANASSTDAGKLQAELERLTSDLEEHFAYEEEHLLPALNGTAQLGSGA
jgi:deazaflavin-dependent oxidoreductase (nitroreductase family)